MIASLLALALGATVAPHSAPSLSAEEAVALALERSPALRASIQRLEEERARERATGGLSNPELRVNNLRSDRLVTPAVEHTPYGDHPFEDASIGLRWSPPSLAELSSRRTEAAQRVACAEAELADDRREVSARTRALHATAWSLGRQVELARATVDLRRKRADLAQQRAEENAGRALDRIAAELDAAEALAGLQELETRRRRTLSDLATEIGAAGSELELAGDAALACEAPPDSLEALLGRGLENSPRLRVWRARLAEVEAARSSERAANVPWFDFIQVSYVFAGDHAPGFARLGLGLSLPLLHWHGPELDALEHRHERFAAESQGERDALVSRIRQVFVELGNEAALVKRLRATEPLLETSKALLEKALQAGQTDLLQVTAFQARSLDAQRARMQAELRCRLAVVELERLVGREPEHESPPGRQALTKFRSGGQEE